jgi:hypothetical protein
MMILSYAGQILLDNHTMGSYNIVQWSDIHLAVKGPGGAPKRPRAELDGDDTVDTTILRNDPQLVKDVLKVEQLDILKHITTLSDSELASLNAVLLKERSVERTVLALSKWAPGMGDLLDFEAKTSARISVCKAHAAQITKEGMLASKFNDGAEGFQVVKFKRFVQGLLTLRGIEGSGAAASAVPSRRARRVSPAFEEDSSGDESGAAASAAPARRSRFPWF